MSNPNMQPSYDEIRRMIERRYRRTLLLGLHVTAFVLVALYIGWWMLTHVVYYPDVNNLGLLLLWAFVLFIHWCYFRLTDTRDQEIKTAWERYAERPEQSSAAWESETDNRLELSDDDEWRDWTDEPDALHEKPKRRG